MAVYKSIVDLIGNTPLLLLGKENFENIDFYAKLEYLNPFGSIKDRTAWGMIKDYINEIKKDNKKIIEASSGNTIKALQILANVFDLVGTLSVTNRIRVEETRDILKILGTEIMELPGKSACIDPNNPDDPLYVINDLLIKNKDSYFYTNQYFNEDNPKIHYETTGEEILRDLNKVDYLFVTLGTTGSSKGIILKLREKNPDLKVIGIASSKKDFIPGIRNEAELLEVGIYEKKYYDEIFYVDSEFAIDGMLELIKKYGVLAGPSSGVVYYKAKNYFKNKRINRKINVVIILCDRFEWYISYIKKRKPEIFGFDKKEDEKSIKNFNPTKSKPKEIEPEKVYDFIKKHSPIIIDVRSNIAYKFFHLESAINIQEDFFEEIIDKKEIFPKNKKILIVCSMGVTSFRLAGYLRFLGYDAFSLKGGMNNLKKI